MHPHFEFFEQITKVFRAAAIRPYFNDKSSRGVGLV